MIPAALDTIQLTLKQENEQTLVFDPIRRRWLLLTPEEYVRQCIIHYLIHALQYPQGMIAIEKQIMVGRLTKRFDLIVYDRNHQPWMLVECKAPEVTITEKTLHQLLNYQRTMQCRYWLLTNGHQVFCADACDVNNIAWLNTLPAYNG